MARPASPTSYCDVAAIAVLLCLAIAGCTTASPEADPAPADSEAGSDSLPPPVNTYILSDDPAAVLALRPERWEEVAPAVERVASALPLGPVLDSNTSTVRERGLFPYLARRLGGVRVPRSLLGDGPVYVRLEGVGDDAYLRAARVGLPVPAPERGGVYPAGTLTRFLIPSAQPAVLAEAIETQVDDGADLAVVTSEHEGFCRVDAVRLAPYVDEAGRGRILDRLANDADGRASPPRSPTAGRFARATGPVAAYTDIGALRQWYLTRRGIEIGTEIHRANREDRRRWIVRGSAVSTAVQLMALRSAREIDDYVVRLTGDGEGGFRLVGTGTRTAVGRNIWTATADSRTLPAISVPATPDETLVADLSFGRDWRALERQSPGAVDVLAGPGAALRTADEMARVPRVAGAGSGIGFLHSPAHVYRLGATVSRERFGVPPPSSLRFRLARVPGESARPLRGKLYADVELDGIGEARRRSAERLRRLLDQLEGRELGLDYRLTVGDAGTGRLTMTAGASVDEVAGGGAEPVGPDLQMAATPGRIAETLELASADSKLVRTLEGLDVLPPVHVATASSPTRVRFRLQTGAQSPDPLEVEASDDSPAALPGDAACLDRLTVAIHKFKRTLPALEPVDLDAVTELLEGLSRSLDDCRQGSGLEASYIDWVLGRASWLGGWRAEIAWRKRLSGPDENDLARETARALYRRACDRGDAAGCRAERVLANNRPFLPVTSVLRD